MVTPYPLSPSLSSPIVIAMHTSHTCDHFLPPVWAPLCLSDYRLFQCHTSWLSQLAGQPESVRELTSKNNPKVALSQRRKVSQRKNNPASPSLIGTIWMHSTWYLRQLPWEWGKPSLMPPLCLPLSSLPPVSQITSQINDLLPESLLWDLLYTVVLLHCVYDKTYTEHTLQKDKREKSNI